jgi:hypothetical protein
MTMYKKINGEQSMQYKQRTINLKHRIKLKKAKAKVSEAKAASKAK